MKKATPKAPKTQARKPRARKVSQLVEDGPPAPIEAAPPPAPPPPEPDPTPTQAPAELHDKREQPPPEPPPPPAPKPARTPVLSFRGLIIAAVVLGLLALVAYGIDEAARRKRTAQPG